MPKRNSNLPEHVNHAKLKKLRRKIRKNKGMALCHISLLRHFDSVGNFEPAQQCRHAGNRHGQPLPLVITMPKYRTVDIKACLA